MKKYIQLPLLVSMLGMMLLLTGCDLGLMGDIIIPGGNSTDLIQGEIVEAGDFTWGSGQSLPATYLLDGERLVIAVSPFDSSTLLAKDYTVRIDAAISKASGARGIRSLTAARRFANLQKEPTVWTEEAVLAQGETTPPADDLDYFTYTGHPGESGLSMAAVSHSDRAKEAGLQSGTRNFHVRTDANSNTYRTVSASLVKSSSNLEIYATSDLAISSTILDKMASEFDWKVYPKVTNFMGIPYDKDHNNRTTILITPLVFNGSATKLVGYFDEVNLFDKTGSNYSNEADMFYMNANVVQKGDMNQIYANLAHEFAHLVFASRKYQADPYGIRFAVHQYSDRWFNEGCAMLATHLAGYASLNNDWRIYDRNYGYFGNPQRDSLLVWESNREESNYGSAALFAYYLYEHYRSDYSAVLNTSGKVEVAIENYMNDFSQIFRNWMLTNLGDRLKGYSEYHYQYLTLKSSPALKTLTGSTSFTVRGMGVQYIVIDGPAAELDLTLTYTNASILNAGYLIIDTK